MSNTATPDAKELSPLRRAYLALERMDARCRALEQARAEPIAVVGMACRLPGGAADPESYWRLLREGVDAVTDAPAGRWDVDAFYDPDPAAPGKMCTKRGGFLREPIDAFDPACFGISPREAETMDPQQRLLLEVASEALENAAQVEDRLAGSATGVFIGMTSHDFADYHLADQDYRQLGAHIITGNTGNAAAGRLSYCFGFAGPCLAVDTACSSSLVAIHLACQSLRNKECRRALAGGVNLMLSPVPTIALSQGRVLAPDGVCRAFDAAASGMVRGEGCAVIVLKRLGDALADGDNILAVIRNTAVNQDGPSSGLTVPNGPAQEALIREALRGADLRPEDIDYLEAHGTGTPLGDPIELRALANVFGGGRDRPLVVGSVKTNIGHLEACSGVASLLKVVLSLGHQEIPAHLHFSHPTPHLPWDELPLAVPAEARPWPAGARPRRAGVSSFGFSGVNAHIVLEEAPVPPPPAGRGAAVERPLHLLALAGRSETLLQQTAARFAEHFRQHPDLNLADAAYSAGVGRAVAGHRLAVVASTLEEARDRLTAFVEGQTPPGVVRGEAETPPKVAFLFTGQGSQYVGMGRELYDTQPAFRRTLDRCDEILRPHLPRPLLAAMFGQPGTAALDDTMYAQPALFALGYALAELWRSWGVRPAVALGHSLGEYVAACVAGVFSLEDGLMLVAERARLMQSLPKDGAMCVVFADAATVEAALRPCAAEVAIAAYNAPENVVVSGRAAAIEALAAQFAARGVKTQPLRVSHAFHSPSLDPILDAFEAKLRAIPMAAPKIGVISNLDGGLAAADFATPGYWRRHLRQPVRFAAGVETARAQGCAVFLELGPKPTLLGLAQQSAPDDSLAWLASLRPGQSDWQTLLDSLATLYTRGTRLDWAGFERDYPRRRLALPTTPFQRRRCWPEPPAASHARRPAARSGHPLLGGRLDVAGMPGLCFESRLDRDDPAYLRDHAVFGEVILPAAGYLEMAVAAGAAALGTDGVALENVAFERALILPETGARTVQTLLRPDGADAFGFQIHSRGDDPAAEPWVRHASGRIIRDGRSGFSPTPLVDSVQGRAKARPTDMAAGDVVDVAALYEGCRARGVDFGPRFHALRRAWRRDDTALAELALPEALGAGAAAYHLHPVLLDAAFQAMGAVFAGREGGADDDVHLPVAVDRLRVHRRGGASGWSRVRVEPVRGERDQSLKVDLTLLDSDGGPVASLEGLHLKRADREQLRAASGQDCADWLYEADWRLAEPEPSAAPPDYLPGLAALNGTILPALAVADSASAADWTRYGAFIDGIETAAAHYALAALRQLGGSPPREPSPTVEALAAQCGVVAGQRRLFGRLLGIAAELGATEPQAAARLADLFHAYPDARAELTLLQRCGERLADVLRGECDPLGLLFPPGEGVTAANMYKDSPGARVANEAVRRLLEALLKNLPADRRARILEIGAGTGGTTARVLDGLPAGRADYTYTDVSPLFVHNAQETFRAYPFLDYRVLNIEAPPLGQGFAPHGYDLVLAANVLHATRDVRQALRHVHGLLAPGGLLVLLEGTAPLRFIDLIFGLTDGWWRFADSDVRPRHPLLSAEGWRSVLNATGFAYAGAVAGSRETGGPWATQALIVARAEPDPAPAAHRPGWLVLAPEDSALAGALRRRLEAAGETALWVYPGDHYQRTAADSLRIDPARPEDFRRLLDDFAGLAPPRVVHLWNAAPAPAAGFAAQDLERANLLGCEAALSLTQALMDRHGQAAPELWLATRGAQPAAGRLDAAGVAGAPLWGFGKVAALEYPELRCVRVDLDGGDPDGDARCLFDELRRGSAEDQVAFREGRRYVARLARHGGRDGALPVRADATYLITGGQRGLGLATAQWLVERGARSLVLLGRRPAESDPDALAALAGMRRAGATVETVAADVGDAARLAAVIAGIDGRLPPLRGIIHSAGALADGTLAQQTADQFRRVLTPKMLGAWHLHALSLGRELDFFVLYSSLAALFGSAGQANHAAANAFLDTLAHYRHSLGLPALSINWGVWSDIGAAARHQVGQRAKAQGMGSIAPRQGLRILERLMAREAVQVGVAPIDWPVFARQSAAGRPPPFFADFAAARPAAGTPERVNRTADIQAELRAAPAPEREARLAAHLRAQVAVVLRLAPEDVSLEAPLNRIGLDSLMAVELRNRLRSQLGLDVPLVRFMEDVGIRALAAELNPRLATPAPEPEPEPSPPKVSEPGPAYSSGPLDDAPLLAQLDRLDQLSDDEVDALLSAALADGPARLLDEARP